MNIYVGNLSYNVTDDDLKEIFEEFGAVTSLRIITDKFSGKSKGFAFIEMANTPEGEAAVEALDGKEISGRKLKVNRAHSQEQGGRGGSRGGNGGGRGGNDRGGSRGRY